MHNSMPDSQGKKIILCVEDEVEILSYYSSMLGKDYHIVTASTGKQALGYIGAGNDFDLALVDYNLPDITGLEILIKIRSIKPLVPVIIVTAYGSEELAVKSFRHGAIDYLNKPLSYDLLARKIRASLSGITEDDTLLEQQRTNTNVSNIEDPNYYKIHKALKYIHENYTNQITLAESANAACLSKYYFSKLFKKIVGDNYQEYVNKLRTEKAKELLRYSNETITGIAYVVGYVDITQFERIFKRIVGSTPSSYRTVSRSQ
jgi:two-component system, response regulator YesN